jgi:hypothetical protein
MRVSFEEQCAAGEAADAAWAAREYANAERAYQTLLQKVTAGQELDTFVVAKIALGLLLSHIAQDDEAGAHQIWTQTREDGALGVGVWSLENGQTSVHDLMIYFLICAHLHSLNPARDQAVNGVNDFMSRVAAYAAEEDPSLLPLVVSNWQVHLREIFESELDAVPREARGMFDEYSSRLSAHARLPLAFPRPSPWKIDWLGPDAKATVYGPDGSTHRVSAAELADSSPARGRGWLARILGR